MYFVSGLYETAKMSLPCQGQTPTCAAESTDVSSWHQCMDQPCVAREIGKLAVFGLAPMYPASNWSSCSGPSWNTRASDLISVDASTGKTCHQYSDAPGRPFLHLFLPLADLGGVTAVGATRSSITPHLTQF